MCSFGLGVSRPRTWAAAAERLQVPGVTARPPGGRGVRKRNPKGAGTPTPGHGAPACRPPGRPPGGSRRQVLRERGPAARVLCGRGGLQHHLPGHEPVRPRLFPAPERGRECQLRPVPRRAPQRLRVQKPGPSGGSLSLPGDLLPQFQPHPLGGWLLLPQARQQTAQALLRKEQSPGPAAWRSRRDDPPTTVLSAEATLRQAGEALGQGRGPRRCLLGGGPGQQRLTPRLTRSSARRRGGGPDHTAGLCPGRLPDSPGLAPAQPSSPSNGRCRAGTGGS
ncbi:uncharacterized protein C1orf159 homolog isoform X3 [Phyllostomus hastatus]|uniref:uncharacterized protein C1orf159 homolog isoform X3 n=1 Tax=Phyllostomus hastatus TaxID=9423 RepID=UPI001E67FDF8|nr:uncharacterized protein C1orf159 homolog isoform X3 [Phyllostomus hastatus]